MNRLFLIVPLAVGLTACAPSSVRIGPPDPVIMVSEPMYRPVRLRPRHVHWVQRVQPRHVHRVQRVHPRRLHRVQRVHPRRLRRVQRIST
ncbi:MAG: hypothetical protein [Olavius algarvensis Gamma 1 endosymbiont]|nr:MAG: hypothetical protein [Olavius algarvensis Gamma 1 endosymbiont]